jgi:spoIIIJ-associated protein
MTRQLKFEGRNVAEAVDKACQALAVDAKNIKYDVISYGSTGIFGLVGARKAKITVKRPHNSPKKVPASAQQADSSPPAQAGVRHPGEAATTPKSQSDPSESSPVAHEFSVEAARAEAYLLPIAEAISDNPTVESRYTDNGVEVDLNCDNPAVLIGKRGQTLMAMQYLVERALNHRQTMADKRVHVNLDVAGYQANRRENLIKLSYRLAEKAQRSGKPFTIGQLNPAERRIVHVALKKNQDVRTHSSGAGFVRKLTIFPKSSRRNHANAGR